MAFKKTKKGYLMRSNNGDWMLSVNVRKYVNKINAACIPAIKDLNLMSKDLATMVRYCCKGGRERMKKAFMVGVPAGSSFSNVVEAIFNSVMERHPEFEECANAWKFVNLIKIDENGLFAADDAVIEERNKVYIIDPECMAFVDKAQKIADLINDLIPQSERKSVRFGFNNLKELLFFNGEEGRFEASPGMTEYSIKKMFFVPSHSSPFGKDREFCELKSKEIEAKNLAYFKAKAKEFGLDEQEAEESIDADNN